MSSRAFPARRWLALAVASSLMLSAACRDNPASRASAPEPSMPPEETAPAITPGPDIPTALIDNLIAAVRAEKGNAAVELVRAEAVTWPDAALGCPQPNLAYAQVVTKGYWVILRSQGEEFDFRATDAEHFSRCTGATRQPPIVYPDEDR